MKTGVVPSIMASFLLLAAVSSFADTSIKAEVDKTSITTDDILTYKLTIATDERKLPEPELPDFAGFAVIYSARSSTVSFARNSVWTSVSYSYILAPPEAGRFTIEPGRIKARGKVYSSQAFEIEVKQGTSQPQTPQKVEPPQPQRHIPESKEPQITL
jgi:hypothetical protein